VDSPTGPMPGDGYHLQTSMELSFHWLCRCNANALSPSLIFWLVRQLLASRCPA